MRLDLDGLADASREALMSEWREVVGRPPPKHLSRPLMVQILSHAYQVDTVGGYTKLLDRRLKSSAQRDVRDRLYVVRPDRWAVLGSSMDHYIFNNRHGVYC